MPQLPGHLCGRGAAVQPDVTSVLKQGGDAGRDPDFGGVVLDFALPVFGVLTAKDQAAGSAVDPAENPMEGQYVQVTPDRRARGATFSHELVDRDLLAVAQEFADAAVALLSGHEQMLRDRDHLITYAQKAVVRRTFK